MESFDGDEKRRPDPTLGLSADLQKKVTDSFQVSAKSIKTKHFGSHRDGVELHNFR